MQQTRPSSSPNEMFRDTMGATIIMAIGCMVVMMALMTLLGGVIKIVKQDQGVWMSIAPGAGLLVVGAVFVIYAIAVFRKGAKEKELRGRFPDEPWRWKPEWSEGVIVDSPGGFVGCFGFAALFWNVFGMIALIEVLNRNPFAEDKEAYLIFLVPLIGLGLLGCFIYFYFQKRKYGKSELRLETFPGIIGGELVAVLTIPTTILPTESVRVKLDNTVTKRRSDPHNRSTTITIWKEEQRLTSWQHSGRSTIVGISFKIPSDARPTTMDLINNVEWSLVVEIETSGTDYWAFFEVPVFDRHKVGAS